MEHPADQFGYATYMDAAVAGAAPATMEAVNDWVDLWNEGRGAPAAHDKLHDALGMDFDTYSRVFGPDDPKALAKEVKARREALDDPEDSPLILRFGVPASSQEGSFMNATLTGLKSGLAMSVAVTPPDDLAIGDPEEFRTMMRTAFRRLVDTGWKVEMRIGPDDQTFEASDAAD